MELVRYSESFDSSREIEYLTEEMIKKANFELLEVAIKLIKSNIGDRLLQKIFEPECELNFSDFNFMFSQDIAIEELEKIVDIPLFSAFSGKIMAPGVKFNLRTAVSYSHMKRS